MKGICRSLIPVLGLLALLLAIPALAMSQDEILHVNVPFSFIVRNTNMPAGEYMVTRPSANSPGLLMIRSTKGKHAVYCMTYSASLAPGVSPKSELVFEKVGGKEFLSQIWQEDSNIGSQVPKSKIEKIAEQELAMTTVHAVKAYRKPHAS